MSSPTAALRSSPSSRATGPSESSRSAAAGTLEVRPCAKRDLDAIVAIDAIHSSGPKPLFWAQKLALVVEGRHVGGECHAGFVACKGEQVLGFVFVEGRAWEFGSPLCGWITAIGVRPEHARRGIALALCREVCAWLRSLDIASVRTMVRRDDVDVLSFFRASGFRAGPYLELELDL